MAEQERMRQEFIANASHELKTPTMAISAVVEALQAGAAEDNILRPQFLSSLEKLVVRLTSLLQDLLDITRLDSAGESVGHETINVPQLIRDAVEQVKAQAQRKKINISVQLPEDGAESEGLTGLSVLGNYLQLQRALINILTNAINYSPDQGSVTVIVEMAEHEQVQIKIQDTGPGIDPSDLPHIFERFYRADKARSRTSGGTGLGLAITREIIARHHGTIAVESTLGKGSLFTINLPVFLPAFAKVNE